jgi:hypothetical protein
VDDDDNDDDHHVILAMIIRIRVRKLRNLKPIMMTK